MAFVKEFRSVRDPFPEWEYLNGIGVRNFLGKPLKKYTIELVVDRENNYYLIPQGHTGRAYTDEDVHYFALCIKDKIIELEVLENSIGNCIRKDYEMVWTIRKIVFPENWSNEILEGIDLTSIIEEAFTVETYNEVATEETVKSITVNITADV